MKIRIGIFYILTIALGSLYAQEPNNNIQYIAKVSKENDNELLERIKYLNLWVAKHIKYDESLDYNKIIGSELKYKTPEELQEQLDKLDIKLANYTIIQEKAVCHGYAALLKTLINEIGAQARIITGYAHTDPTKIGDSVHPNHAWIEFKYNNSWNFIDPTWSAGYRDVFTGKYIYEFQPIYFMMNHRRWKLTHFPTDEDKKILVNSPVFYKKYFEADLHIPDDIEGTLEAGTIYYLKVDGLEDGNTLYFQNGGLSGRLERLNKRYTIPKLRKGTFSLFYQNEIVISFRVK